MRRRIDFDEINRSATPYALAICRRLFPDGHMHGCEYVARAPHRADRSAGSFSINVRSGKWADFATGEKGGDLVSLVAFALGVSQPEGARALAQLIGREA